MEKNNLDLFKQALSEGLSNKFDSVANTCAYEIACSEKHELAMKTIMYGKTSTKKAWSPRMKKIIAILIAAALLLTSCGIIFRHEIRDIIEDVSDFFIKLTYSGNENEGMFIEEVYELSYVPEGYFLKDTHISHLIVRYVFCNDNNEILFEQGVLDGTTIYIDNEEGYKHIFNVANFEVYYKSTNQKHNYYWNDGKYLMNITSSSELTNDEITSIILGISKH